VQAREISYFKPINPFQRFDVLSRLAYWDGKYWYTEHRFMIGEHLCALLQVSGVFVHRGSVIPMSEVLALSGVEVDPPDKPENVSAWHSLIEVKKDKVQK
jgi:hypothetical protein